MTKQPKYVLIYNLFVPKTSNFVHAKNTVPKYLSRRLIVLISHTNAGTAYNYQLSIIN